MDSNWFGLTFAVCGKVAIAGGRKTSKLAPMSVRSTARVRAPDAGMTLVRWRNLSASGGRMSVGTVDANTRNKTCQYRVDRDIRGKDGVGNLLFVRTREAAVIPTALCPAFALSPT